MRDDMDHLSRVALWALAEDEPRVRSGANDAAALRHLESCARCRKELEQCRRLLSHERDGAWQEAPSGWADAAVARIERARTTDDKPGLIETAHGAIKLIVATLKGDTGAGPALVGVRSAGASTARTLFYESPIGDIYVRIAHKGNRNIEVQGQVILNPGSPRAATRATLQSGRKEFSAAVNDSGDFVVIGRVQASFDIRLEAGDTLVLLRNIEP
jgi:hypothetical protein